MDVSALKTVMPLLGVGLASYIPSDPPRLVIWALRGALCLVIAAAVAVYVRAQRSIERTADQTVVTLGAEGVKQVKNRKRTGGDEQVREEAGKTTTVFAYDASICKKEMTQVLIIGIATLLLHYVFMLHSAVLVNLVSVPLNVLDSGVIRAHVLGQQLPRPFPQPKGFWQSMKSEVTELRTLAANADASASESDAATRARRFRESQQQSSIPRVAAKKHA